MSIQRLDFEKVKRDTQCAFLIEEETLWQLRKLAIEKHFKNVSELMRFLAKGYLEQEKEK